MKLFIFTNCLAIFALLIGSAEAAPEMFVMSGLNASGQEVSPQWEPGTGRLAFLKKDTFFIYDLKSDHPPKSLTSKGLSGSAELSRQLAFAWSPTGDHTFALLCSEKNGRLGLYLGRDYQLTRKLLDFPLGGEGIRFSKLSFSPDGKEIIYSDNGILYKLSIQKKPVQEKLLTNNIANSGAQSWGVINPMHKDILAFQLESEGRVIIYVYHRVLKKIIGIFKEKFSACHPCWSPDGKKLAFFSNQAIGEVSNDDTRLSWNIEYVVYDHSKETISIPHAMSTKDSIRKKAPSADFTPICWTADSKKIIYAGYGESNSNELVVANLQTGKTSTINLGNKIDMNTFDGHSTSWNMKVIYSDISSTCVDNNCYLAFAADVNIGEQLSRIIIRNIKLDSY